MQPPMQAYTQAGHVQIFYRTTYIPDSFPLRIGSADTSYEVSPLTVCRTQFFSASPEAPQEDVPDSERVGCDLPCLPQFPGPSSRHRADSATPGPVADPGLAFGRHLKAPGNVDTASRSPAIRTYSTLLSVLPQMMH